jgi:hypothetical protein
MNTTAFGVERGTLIRVPATANLMVDSADRDTVRFTNPFDFTINKSQPYVTGFFSRIGATEVVMEWGVPNVSAALGNNTFGIVDTSGNTTTITVPDGFYTVAEVLEIIASTLNISVPAAFGYVFDAFLGNTTAGPVRFGNTAANLRQFSIRAGTLASQLSLNTTNGTVGPSRLFTVSNPDLRPYRYVDIVCEQLTSVQDARDATTQQQDRTVLVRWYFSWDQQPELDALLLPILMGYTRFCARRLYNPPKQIKWEQNLPISNLTFTIYDESGNIVVADNTSNLLMTLQLSEG